MVYRDLFFKFSKKIAKIRYFDNDYVWEPYLS